MVKQDIVTIDYPGSCISVNHYLGRRKGGGYYVKQEAKNWMEEFMWLLKPLHLEDYKLPLEVTCSGWFKDERSAPDLSNLSKIIMDSIEELTGINDKDFRWHDGQRVLMAHRKAPPPYLLIQVKESEESMLDTSPERTKSTKKPLKARGSMKLPKQGKSGIEN